MAFGGILFEGVAGIHFLLVHNGTSGVGVDIRACVESRGAVVGCAIQEVTDVGARVHNETEDSGVESGKLLEELAVGAEMGPVV